MAKKTKKELNLEKSIAEFYRVSSEARKNCAGYLKWAVKKYGRKNINDNGKVTFTLEFNDQNLEIAYDGGNHREYASNCYSSVYAVNLCLGEISFYIEDSSHYGIDRVKTADLLEICGVIKILLIPHLADNDK